MVWSTRGRKKGKKGKKKEEEGEEENQLKFEEKTRPDQIRTEQ